MEKIYTILQSISYVRDSPEHIDLHIKSGDYFLFLATMMGVMEDLLHTCEQHGDVTKEQRAYARELRNDLRYIQANYHIVPRELGDIQTIEPSGNLLLK